MIAGFHYVSISSRLVDLKLLDFDTYSDFQNPLQMCVGDNAGEMFGEMGMLISHSR